MSFFFIRTRFTLMPMKDCLKNELFGYNDKFHMTYYFFFLFFFKYRLRLVIPCNLLIQQTQSFSGPWLDIDLYTQSILTTTALYKMH